MMKLFHGQKSQSTSKLDQKLSVTINHDGKRQHHKNIEPDRITKMLTFEGELNENTKTTFI